PVRECAHQRTARFPLQALHATRTGATGRGAARLARLTHRASPLRLPGAAQDDHHGLLPGPGELGRHRLSRPTVVTQMSGFLDGRTLRDGQTLKADACVIGSGAGGAVTAATLQAAGIETIVLEEGGHYTKKDFHMREDEAFPHLYQEAAARMTKDLGV